MFPMVSPSLVISAIVYTPSPPALRDGVSVSSAQFRLPDLGA
ncbi:hypothetical protein RSAG8_05806, partial [Rhizoctonia solani AG-8 WAC10335]